MVTAPAANGSSSYRTSEALGPGRRLAGPMPPDDGLEAYAERVETFTHERDWDRFHTPKDLAIGLVSESAELLELFRFLSEDEAMEALEEDSFRQRVADELGDTLFFLVRFCNRFGFDLLEVASEKLEKSDEKYPPEAYTGVNRKVFDQEGPQDQV